jgi:hypothetical protein
VRDMCFRVSVRDMCFRVSVRVSAKEHLVVVVGT